MVKRNYETEHICLIPDLRGKALCFSSLSMMLIVGFSVDSFLSSLESFPLFLVYWGLLSWMSYAFFAPVDMINYINWFLNVESALHTWDKSYLVMMYNSLHTFVDLDSMNIYNNNPNSSLLSLLSSLSFAYT